MATAQHDWSCLPSSEEDRMIALLRDAPEAGTSPATADILRILETTGSFRLRNAAALALVDRGAADEAWRIGALLTRAEVAPQSGTLLYALDELGGRLPLDGLVAVLRGGSFEARSEALGMLDAGRISVADSETRHRALEGLSAIAAGPDAEAAEAAREALAILADPGLSPSVAAHHR